MRRGGAFKLALKTGSKRGRARVRQRERVWAWAGEATLGQKEGVRARERGGPERVGWLQPVGRMGGAGPFRKMKSFSFYFSNEIVVKYQFQYFPNLFSRWGKNKSCSTF
jgi:hypothetical protein